MSVIDNDWGPGCNRDGHVDLIASELEAAYYRYYDSTENRDLRRRW